ncbi:DJ-1/PfpI family protein [Funiculus sociatus GB2-A5]|uniref:DJ-1/PfpI family protein n=1 Tax=Funiculus sociatus GB2-A5 TaxID=2933946 RepID=A0ABV0JWP6_9CYAN|nr:MULTISPECIES: DJ-1/PfpI family protein [unclassified Trichocoleus]MBD1906307.1 DJ-1/PfpI family protein [Trichocoleus sp. FACHB-832]MBD2063177.1 DJ-1/PfpI family protein [Trichocoleus sp. FACHB-6]
MTHSQQYVIGLVFYPGMTALDIIGPQTVFATLPGIQIHRIWKTLDPIQTDDGMKIIPDTTFGNCPPLDIICIGGGLGQSAVVDDPEILAFLRQQGSMTKFITSVCGGSEFLAKAGLLQGYRSATHWMFREQLAAAGVQVGTERVVIDRNRMSGGGVTAGIDFGLEIAKVLYGEETAKLVQLLMEYDPAPPFDVGSPEKAGAELVNKAMVYAAEVFNLPITQVA